MSPAVPSNETRNIYTVSGLTEKIKFLLEENFSFIWINGEISNLSKAASGHLYFTLKDKRSQIGAVMFRGQNRNLKYLPENGMSVTGFGRINLYEPRGTYQIILEYLEPEGVGSLQAAFEQLKAKLTAEGLFNDEHKKKIPFLPRKISVVTSPSGSVIHDIIHVLSRRFPGFNLQVVPAAVQGTEAENQISSALDFLNSTADTDVIIVARGGGSLEDLAPFNSETVARAVFRSEIPVISAVGHETDFTITDFVSDLRAPTPSAAAEIVMPEKSELYSEITRQNAYLEAVMANRLSVLRASLDRLVEKLRDPRRRIDDFKIKTDDHASRLSKAMARCLVKEKQRLEWLTRRLYANSPKRKIAYENEKTTRTADRLYAAMDRLVSLERMKLGQLDSRLETLSPHNVMDRGYSISLLLPGKKVVTDAEKVDIGDRIKLLLARGSLTCRIEGKQNNGKKNV